VSSLRPIDVLNKLPLGLGQADLTAQLLNLLAYLNTDFQIGIIPVFTETASGNVNKFIEPVDADTEFLVYAISVQDNSTIDNADNVVISYRDELIGNVVRLIQGTPSQFTASIVEWPLDIITPTSMRILDTPLVVKLRSNGEPSKRIQINFVTTSTIGTRNWAARYLYRARPRLLV
jgi:hypothetical protein